MNTPPTVRWWQRPFMPLVASRFGGWFFVTIAPTIDRLLLRLSGGRISTAIGHPSLLLTTIGAKSGTVRTTPLIFLPIGEQAVVIASNGGGQKHPGWYYNLRANPSVNVTIHGKTGPYLAHEALGQEREQLWQQATRLYPGYVKYQQRATTRQIPVIVLTPTH